MNKSLMWRVLPCVGAAIATSPASQAQVATPYTTVTAAHSAKCLRIAQDATDPDSAVVQYTCEGSPQDRWSVEPVGSAWRLVLQGTGQCLGVWHAAMSDGAAVVQMPCENQPAQLWRIRTEGATARLQALHSEFCLTVPGSAMQDGAALVQSSCSGSTAQAFRFTAGWFGDAAPASIVVKHSGMCLQVRDASSAQEANVVQVPCNGAAAAHERWRLQPEEIGFRVVAEHSGQCLSVARASYRSGAALVQAPCNGRLHQRWRLLPSSGGGYRLVALHSGMCLDVPNSSREVGSRLIQHRCHGGANQRWTLAAPSRPARWSEVIPLSIVPVAAAHLPDGKLLTWSAYDRLNFGGDHGYTYTVIFDPATLTGSERVVSETGHDMFCPGIANLADGRILVNGGSSTARTSIYDPATATWSADAQMNIGRGYEGTTLLANGSVLTLGGSWSGGQGGKDGERWTAGSGWQRLPGVPVGPVVGDDPEGIYRADNHLWLLTLAGGRVLHAGPSASMNWIDADGEGSITSAGRRGDDAYAINGNAVLYDVGRILKVGGAPAYQRGIATNTAHVIEHNGQLSVRQAAPMAYARGMHNSVVLPTGEVLVIGGVAQPASFTDDRSVLVPELWNPQTELFTRLPAMRTPRNYHSVALLLQDGRVFAGGGGLCGPCAVNHPNAEVLTPPYLLNADGSPATRPAITAAPASARHGEVISASTDMPVSGFALIRLSSVTHSVNNDQRRIPLRAFSSDGQNYSLTLPADPGVATPGLYMLFAISSQGVPSVARVLLLRLG